MFRSDRTIEYSEFIPRNVKLAIPCYDDGEYKLAICNIAFLKGGLLPSQLGRLFFKLHGINNLNNKLPAHLSSYDPVCLAKPLLATIQLAAGATDDEWRGVITDKRLNGIIGATMLTLNQGGYVLYDEHYCRMPKGHEFMIPPFRITGISDVVKYDGSDFLRTHAYKRATYKYPV